MTVAAAGVRYRYDGRNRGMEAYDRRSTRHTWDVIDAVQKIAVWARPRDDRASARLPGPRRLLGAVATASTTAVASPRLSAMSGVRRCG
jgi:hypothetical protein